MIFDNFPTDILLYLLSYLDLNDVLCFLSACSTLRRLSGSRSLWIEVLQRTRTLNSLPCPVGEDLSQLDLLNLQRIAQRTNRLDKNWNRESPSIMGAMRVGRLGRQEIQHPLSILTVIPGTDMLLLYSTAQNLVCYDMQAGRSLAHLHVGVVDTQAHYDVRWKHFVAMVIRLGPDEQVLRVVCVEYGPGMVTTIQHIYQMALLSECIAMFIHAGVVGVLFAHDAQLSMKAVNIMTEVTVTIPVELSHGPHPNSYFGGTYYCYVLEHSVYLVGRSTHFVHYVYQCNVDVLPYGGTRGNPERRFVCSADLTIDELTEELGVLTIPCRLWSPTGLTAGYIKYPSSYSEPITTSFWFHSTASTNDTKVASAHLTFLGEVRSSQPSPFFTPSGNYMVSMVDCPDVEDISTKLQLTRFTKDPIAIHVMHLDMPFFIDLTEIRSVAVDDHCGVVYLCNLRGYIFAVPFA